MTAKIIFVNQQKLSRIDLSTVVDCNIYDWNKLIQLGKWLHFDSFYPRAGKNNIPLNNDIVNQLNFSMPQYIDHRLSFDDITNARCQEIVTQYTDQPCVVMYSGGIDSTVIVASILKNTTAADRKNIFIACNNVSIYENPQFFLQHIQPNFQIISSELLTDNDSNRYYIIDGEPADQLYSGGISQGLMLSDSSLLSRNVHLDPDKLISHLISVTDVNFAHWFYELVIENINSVDIPIETYHDFFWWFQFNYTWAGVKLRKKPRSNDSASLQLYFNKFIQWYDTTEYQQWSMTNNQFGIKFNDSIGGYKLASKKYIYDLDHNEYYFKFKTKKYSNSLGKKVFNDQFCILDDLSTLSLPSDLDKILELLPAHIIQ